MIFKNIKLIFLITTILILATSPAYAYIDPGTGSSIIQGLLAVVVAIPFVLKASWKKIKVFFNKNQKKEG